MSQPVWIINQVTRDVNHSEGQELVLRPKQNLPCKLVQTVLVQSALNYIVLWAGKRTLFLMLSLNLRDTRLARTTSQCRNTNEARPGSASHLCNSKCRYPGVAAQPELHTCILCMYGVTRLGQTEEPDTGKLHIQKRTAGTSCVVAELLHENMHT